MDSVLDKIVKYKLSEIEAARSRMPLTELRRQIRGAPSAQDFAAALTDSSEVSLIAEVKSASPSQGMIRSDFDPGEIARLYQAHGAACVSVLTDQHFFRGSLQHLRAVRATVELPLLRKDFVIDEYQVFEARAAGADAVLLIAECLTADRLAQLHDLIASLGMTALVELYAADSLPSVLQSGARLIGINNRDLHTFETNLKHTLEIKPKLPADKIVVSESGIANREHVLKLAAAGVDAMLVGQSLMEAPDIGSAVRRLLGRQWAGPNEEPI